MDPSELSLKGQVALVTGGARGIGAGIARTLAAFGADVAIADILGDEAKRTAAALRAGGRRAIALPTDVRDEAQVRAMAADTIAQLGRLDILVNNAGGTFHAPFLQVNRRGYQMMIDLNLTSVWTATQAVVEYWIREKVPGRIVNVVSTEGLKACPGRAAYSAAKAGVINLTKTLSTELGPYGIRVNCIAPDYTATEGTAQPGDDPHAGLKHSAEKIPLRRHGTSEDMAGPVLFFASPLSQWVTGQTLVVDGGALWAARVEGAFPFVPQDHKTR